MGLNFRRKLLLPLTVVALVGLVAPVAAMRLAPNSALAGAVVATPVPTPTAPPTTAPAVIERLAPHVISVRPHDTTSFNEGFELVDGVLYESDGEYGRSTMRRTDPLTGAVLTSVTLPPEYFAEGISVVGDKVIQMTWKEGVAFIYDAATLEQVGAFSMTGEGWGMCYDGVELFQSDGSTSVYRRDPATFEVIGQIDVSFTGQPINMINELECVGDQIYANVWLTDFIIRFDKRTGVVNAVIDASGLLTREEQAVAGNQGVLNGIAYDPETETFLITGKFWPKTFEVTFVPAAP